MHLLRSNIIREEFFTLKRISGGRLVLGIINSSLLIIIIWTYSVQHILYLKRDRFTKSPLTTAFRLCMCGMYKSLSGREVQVSEPGLHSNGL